MHTMERGDAFEWHEVKAQSNLKKHGVEFADAVAVFSDDRAITIPDRLTAVDERRLVTIGRDHLGRILVLVYTWRGDRIRVFSARKALPRERREYRRGR